MEYCPYCAEKIYKPSKICPNCKKSLDMDLLQEMYDTGKRDQVNKKIRKKIWFKEHNYIIFPIITLFIGFLVGAAILYSVGQINFANERMGYEDEISNLQQVIEQKDKAAGGANADYQKVLAEKDEIISILTNQKENLSKIIRFTNRLARNSTITPKTMKESDYFIRNFRYLEKQFKNQEEKLKDIGYNPIKSYDLNPIPQLTADNG